MNSFFRSSVLVYYLIGAMCLSFYIFFYRSGSQLVPSSIYLLFAVLLIPVLSYFFDMLEFKKLLSHNYSLREKNTLVGVLIFILILMLGGFVSTLWLTILLGALIAYILRDGRIFFMGALLCLLATVLFLVFGDSQKAESSSILVYYFLVIGVVAEIIMQIVFKQTDTLQSSSSYEK